MDGEPIAYLDAITIDCEDPDSLADFWVAMLGTKEASREGDPVQYIDLEPAAGAPTIRLQRVPEAKTVKNRVHIDLMVEDIDDATRKVEDLGAMRRPDGDFDEYGVGWRVMQDPEGNEFCLLFSRSTDV
jgi:predicted enzyme related to lactoylglutathione lyase